MKGLIQKTLLAMTIVSAMSIASLATAAPSEQAVNLKKPATAKTAYLFVLSAKTGDIKKAANGYTLTLNNVDPHVLWFTDRPNRKAGFVSTDKFISHWAKSFKSSSPNAAMVHVGLSAQVNGKTQPMAMELTMPQFSHGSLTFEIQSLPGDEVIAGQITAPRIFVDYGYGIPGPER